VTRIGSRSSSVTGSLMGCQELTAEVRGQMHALLDRHFSGVTREQFECDLAEKNWVLLLHDGDGALVGFSTLLVYETRDDSGGAVSVVCSGDTIVDPSAWNSAALPREWIGAVNRLREIYRNGPYYWLLITSGFRTYRLLSTFWRTFYPRYDVATLVDQQRLLKVIATERFGDRYDSASGIVRFKRPQMLRPHLAGIPFERLSDPHVTFFAKRNPGHAGGDELVYLCELNESNLTRAGRRMVFGPEARP